MEELESPDLREKSLQIYDYIVLLSSLAKIPNFQIFTTPLTVVNVNGRT